MATTAATDMGMAARVSRTSARVFGVCGAVRHSARALHRVPFSLVAFASALFGAGMNSGAFAQAVVPVGGVQSVERPSAQTGASTPDPGNVTDPRRPPRLADNSADVNSEPAARRWRFEPRVALRQSWTDNIELRDDSFKKSDWVTEVTPGFSIVANGARLKGNLDYAITGFHYAKDSKRNDHQNALNAFGLFQAIDNFFFVEARGQISQQLVSAFGSRPVSNTSDTGNRTETRVFSLTPYVKGELGSVAVYDLRLDVAKSRTEDTQVSDGTIRTWTGKLESTSDLARFGWLVDFKDQRYDVKDGFDSESQLARGSLIYHLSRSLKIFVRAGRESNNYSGNDRSETIHGAGVEWNPTGRTQFSAENDKRFFGRSYRYAWRHRAPLSSWGIVMSKDTTNTIDQLRRGSESTPFQRMFDLLAAEFPDPILRAERARQALIDAGISPDAGPDSASLANQVFMDKRIEGSVALLGARNTLTLSAFRSERSAVSQFVSGGEDFARASRIRENGAAINWSSTLGSLSSLVTSVVWNRIGGSGSATSPGTNQLAFNVQLNRKLSPKTGTAVGYRHVRFDSDGTATEDYRENAIFAMIEHRF